MRRFLVFAVSLALMGSAASQAAKKKEPDEELKAWSEQFKDAWNKHDAKTLASFWAFNGDVINPFGRAAAGYTEVEKLLADEQAGAMKSSAYALTIENVRLLKPDVAVMDWAAEVSGVRGLDGKDMPVFKHHVTWVLIKKAGKWRAAAARPAAPLPEAPAPAPQPAPAPK